MDQRWRYWRNLLVFGLTLLIATAAIGIMVLCYQGAMNYIHPQRALREPGDNPLRLGIPYEEIALRTTDGLTLAGWYTPPKNGALILVAHGYQDKRSTEIHALFARHGYGAISWDFRAHGESEGDICTIGYLETRDIQAALAFALQKPAIKHIGAWGGSMGGASTIQAAARFPEIEAVVTDSSFATLEDELEIAVTVGFLRPFIRYFAEQESGLSMDQNRPVDMIGDISPRPVFIIHGENDSLTPADAARRLFDAAGEPRTLWVEPGVNHMGILSARPEEYERRVIEFFDSALFAGSGDSSG